MMCSPPVRTVGALCRAIIFGFVAWFPATAAHDGAGGDVMHHGWGAGGGITPAQNAEKQNAELAATECMP
jgi:hypothetical protein